MIIYSDICSSRLEYSLKLIFNQILNTEYHIVTDIDQLKSQSGIFINYSSADLENSIKIVPSDLLFETTIKEQIIYTDKYGGLPCIYFSGKGDIPFDIFSAVFYMVSRYEEYLPFDGDVHGRFKAEDSLAYKNGFHQVPVVELWCKLLADKINIPFPSNTYKQKLTIDIDNAWKHLNKGIFRNAGGIVKLLLSGNFTELIEKVKVLTGKIPDPSDTFEYLETIENKLKEPVQYFIQTGTKGKNDRAISIKNKKFRELLLKLNSKKSVGLHPSYLSFTSEKELENEFYSLSSVLRNKVNKSRQHFLLLKFPETYRKIIRLGIREDYTMGWSNQVGFRAGISRPFTFYDLLAEKETHLIIVPFMAMDRTLKDYMKLNQEEALSGLKGLCYITKSVGGEFVMLWHNDSLSDTGEWKGWRTVFEQALEYAEPNQIS
jgi:hypothetical protein